MKFNKIYNSLSELSEWVKSHKLTKGWLTEYSDISSKKFAGTENFAEAENLMLNGWDYGKNEITKIMLDRAASVEAVKRLALSYVGAVPCVPAYLAGSPKNMIAIRRRPVSRPVVPIVYNCAVDYTISTQKIMTAAAKLFNVVRGLELGGVSVELWVCSIWAVGDDELNIASKIKEASQPLNVLNMCYPCVHPSFTRRHVFSIMERAGFKYNKWKQYGCIVRDKNKILNKVAELGINNSNCFNYYELDRLSESEIAAMIK